MLEGDPNTGRPVVAELCRTRLQDGHISTVRQGRFAQPRPRFRRPPLLTDKAGHEFLLPFRICVPVPGRTT